jgi:hypothetical protein
MASRASLKPARRVATQKQDVWYVIASYNSCSLVFMLLYMQ